MVTKESNRVQSIIIGNGEDTILDANAVPISYSNSIYRISLIFDF